jgi:hypothetical protein
MQGKDDDISQELLGMLAEEGGGRWRRFQLVDIKCLHFQREELLLQKNITPLAVQARWPTDIVLLYFFFFFFVLLYSMRGEEQQSIKLLIL